jgi:nitrogen fixation NifU-like protein
VTAHDPRAAYQELIALHARAPHNEGPLPAATHEATRRNPLCGDRVTLRLCVVEGRILEARFEARGCMIARASASLLTELVSGVGKDDALRLAQALETLLDASAPPEDAGPLEPLRGARELPARKGCVLLPWQTLTSALRDEAPR